MRVFPVFFAAAILLARAATVAALTAGKIDR